MPDNEVGRESIDLAEAFPKPPIKANCNSAEEAIELAIKWFNTRTTKPDKVVIDRKVGLIFSSPESPERFCFPHATYRKFKRETEATATILAHCGCGDKDELIAELKKKSLKEPPVYVIPALA